MHAEIDLNDTIYTEPNILLCCIAQMLKCPVEHRVELKEVLKEYKVVFPTELPKTTPPNCRLGNEIRISL